MKTLKLFLMCVAFLALTISAAGQSQNAEINQDGAVELDGTHGLSDSYEIDASQFDFETTKEALDHFKSVNTNYAFYRPVLSRDVVVLYIQRSKQPEWGIGQWNAHLAEHKALQEKQINQTK